ncbi:MAG: diacylglycerol kinase family protein, partial [Dehalococcoidia bacterium]
TDSGLKAMSSKVREIPIARVLLVVNRSSASGHGSATVGRMVSASQDALGRRVPIQVETVDDHPEVKARTADFFSRSGAPALVVAGGGSGTFRAMVEGICEGYTSKSLPGADKVLISALRMGSGNPVARQFSMPLNPCEALHGIVGNLRSGRTASCCIMRCEVEGPDGSSNTYYGATMAGFGQFGRVPGDIKRWHHRFPELRKIVAKALGIERVNDAEYAFLTLARFAWSAVSPNAVESVGIKVNDCTIPMRLLAGVVMNFHIPRLPLEPSTNIEQTTLSLFFLPYSNRWSTLSYSIMPGLLRSQAKQVLITAKDRLELRVKERKAMEFFLDEDPMTLRTRASIQVAGTLAFVPGPGYLWHMKQEVSP